MPTCRQLSYKNKRLKSICKAWELFVARISRMNGRPWKWRKNFLGHLLIINFDLFKNWLNWWRNLREATCSIFCDSLSYVDQWAAWMLFKPTYRFPSLMAIQAHEVLANVDSSKFLWMLKTPSRANKRQHEEIDLREKETYFIAINCFVSSTKTQLRYLSFYV